MMMMCMQTAPKRGLIVSVFNPNNLLASETRVTSGATSTSLLVSLNPLGTASSFDSDLDRLTDVAEHVCCFIHFKKVFDVNISLRNCRRLEQTLSKLTLMAMVVNTNFDCYLFV